jgi:hypothetical protein
MIKTEGAYVADVIILMEYVESKQDPLIDTVRTHHHQTRTKYFQQRTLRSFQS